MTEHGLDPLLATGKFKHGEPPPCAPRGQMMTTIAARQLRIRGLAAAHAQWRFDCAIHDLLKLHRNGGLSALHTA